MFGERIFRRKLFQEHIFWYVWDELWLSEHPKRFWKSRFLTGCLYSKKSAVWRKLRKKSWSIKKLKVTTGKLKPFFFIYAHLSYTDAKIIAVQSSSIRTLDVRVKKMVSAPRSWLLVFWMTSSFLIIFAKMHFSYYINTRSETDFSRTVLDP